MAKFLTVEDSLQLAAGSFNPYLVEGSKYFFSLLCFVKPFQETHRLCNFCVRDSDAWIISASTHLFRSREVFQFSVFDFIIITQTYVDYSWWKPDSVLQQPYSSVDFKLWYNIEVTKSSAYIHNIFRLFRTAVQMVSQGLIPKFLWIPRIQLPVFPLIQDELVSRMRSGNYRFSAEILPLCGSAEIQGYS